MAGNDPPQLDLFAHSHAVELRNDVLDALLKRDAAGAARARAALAASQPGDAALPGLDTLIAALAGEHPEAADGPAAFPTAAALAPARQQLAQSITAAAVAAFGRRDAEAWLRPFWRGLARRAAALPFDPAHADDHAAPLWLQAGDAAAALAAVDGIASWWRQPLPLAWMTQARAATAGIDATWLLVHLLGLERQGRHAELLAARQRLRDQQPALYTAYMRSR